MQTLNEGIAFYSSDKRIMLKNKPFIQYLNLISSKSNLSEEQIFEVKEFKPVIKFVDKQLNSPLNISSDLFPHMEYDLISNDRYFNIRCAFYEDKSFEILIRDNTKLEKRRLIKQQLTSNIAHELKTPVATIMGYMETLQGNGISPKKQKYFIEKAFSQTKRLSELVEDISLLSRIEEAKDHFKLSEVDVNLIIEEVTDSLELKLNEKNINVQFHPRRPIIINGNNSLLFSIFYNLFDNVINYGGENIQVNISQYLEDRKYYYISFSNSGNSIDKKHLARIFERFYRIDAGRSRKKGGTGLGLAIVKNAVQFHKGEITAKKLKGGGVEFLFTLSKK